MKLNIYSSRNLTKVADYHRIACAIGGLVLLIIFSTSSVAAESDAEETRPAVKIFDLQLDDDSSSEASVDESSEQNDSDTQVPVAVEVDNRTTAEKLESLKSEVLAVNRDLFILEEDLLFPASTQLAAYFSVDIGYFFSLDNIKITIDDKPVTHHLYTEKDTNALYRGAIQKVYLGNVSTGEHQIVAILIGYGPHKREYRIAESFTFEKGTEAKALEIQLRDDTGKQQPKLKVVEW